MNRVELSTDSRKRNRQPGKFAGVAK